MNKIHIMLDLETLSTDKNAAIVSIGACVIGKRGKSNEFYQAIDIKKTNPESLGHICKDTVLWWMYQGPEARAVFLDPNRIQLPNALIAFDLWIHSMMDKHAVTDTRNVTVWGNSASFDNVILRNGYNRTIAAPVQVSKVFVQHWNDRCYRTVTNLAPQIKRNQTGIHHNALDDAKCQSRHIVKILRHLGKTIEDVA